MGGKKGAVLNSWIKEFCTLVFIQTVQAFIYAIIISMIVSMAFEKISDTDDRNASMGILSVVALASVFKVEEMVKKIFGIGNSKAEVKGAMASLAKTAIAWQFGKRVLDNGSKMLGGVKNIQDSAKGRAKLKQRMDRDKATFGNSGAGGMALPENQESYQDYYEKAKQAKANGDMDGYRTNMGIAAGMKKNASVAGSDSKSGKNTRDYNAMMDKYQDQLDELKKKKREGIKQIIKGAGETAGAIPGAIGGAIIGGADGNLDEAFRGFSVGAGVGDTIGGAVATTTYDAVSTVSSAPGKVRDTVDTVAKIRNAVKQQQIDGKGLAKAKNLATAYYKEATKNRVSERELQDMIKKATQPDADHAN